jgi:hypothetical protein
MREPACGPDRPIARQRVSYAPVGRTRARMRDGGPGEKRSQLCPLTAPPRPCSGHTMMVCFIQTKKGVSMSSRPSPTKTKFSPRWTIPSLEISAQHDLENARLSSKSPSRRRTTFHLIIAFCLGVAATSGWQSYGNAAKEMIANWSEQFDGLTPAPDVHASDIIAPNAVVAPSPAMEEQASEEDVLQKTAVSPTRSPAAPTPSQVVWPPSDTFVGAEAGPK